MKLQLKRAASVFCTIASVATNISAAGAFELKMPAHAPAPRQVERATYTPDLLIVVPNKNLNDDDLKETMEDVHGTVIGSLGEGDLKCYIVQTEKGHMDDTEKKLSKDKKHFATIGRNYRISANMVPDAATNSQFTQQWHLQAMHCPDAWNTATGSGVKIAVFDTGCSGDNLDLSGKTDKGFDAYGAVGKILGAIGILPAFMQPGMTEIAGAAAGLLAGRADTDTGADSHGTTVATTIAATINNNFAGVGVAPNSRIYPVRIAENKSPLKKPGGKKDHEYTTDLELIAGMIHIMSKPNIRIVNISYNMPVVGFHNPLLHPVLHTYFKKFFYEPTHSGMIFISAGNESFPDPTPPVPYLCVVSGIDSTGKLADNKDWGSNYGPAVMFTGPAVDIGCSDKSGAAGLQSGTSYSCPIVAAVAALVLDKKPLAPNWEVLRCLIRSCRVHNKDGVPVFNTYYGWGMPDAYTAVTGQDPRPPAMSSTSNSPVSFNVAAGHAARRK